jgi:hypothetical protein
MGFWLIMSAKFCSFLISDSDSFLREKYLSESLRYCFQITNYLGDSDGNYQSYFTTNAINLKTIKVCTRVFAHEIYFAL